MRGCRPLVLLLLHLLLLSSLCVSPRTGESCGLRHLRASWLPMRVVTLRLPPDLPTRAELSHNYIKITAILSLNCEIVPSYNDGRYTQYGLSVVESA